MYDPAISQATLETLGAGGDGHEYTSRQALLIQMQNILLKFLGRLCSPFLLSKQMRMNGSTWKLVLNTLWSLSYFHAVVYYRVLCFENVSWKFISKDADIFHLSCAYDYFLLFTKLKRFFFLKRLILINHWPISGFRSRSLLNFSPDI